MGVLIQLAGAIALLLWGIRMVQTGFSRLLGSRMERLLRKTTRNRPLAFSSGVSAAFLLQSSTAVVLMVGGFTASNMMTLTAALATVLGAEFGASLAAFLLNLDVQALALPLVLLGFVFFKNSTSRAWKHTGRITIGVGLVLLSLDLIGQSTSMLSHSDITTLIINRVESDSALAITMLAILTWLIHSTLASVLLIAQFVSDDAISMNAGLFMLLGANLGGAMPALVAGWSLNRKGRQVVIGNLIFRGIAMVLGLLILTLTAGHLSDFLPGGSVGIVVAHSLLNLINGLLLLLFLPWLLPLISRTAPGEEEGTDLSQEDEMPIYLAIDDIHNPRRAIANVRNEAMHIADVVFRMLNNSMDAFDDKDLARQISELDDDIDRLHREALNYILSIDKSDHSHSTQPLRREIIIYMTNLEHIGDIIDASLMHQARTKVRNNVEFDAEEKAVLNRLHDELVDAFRLSQAVFTSDSLTLAQDLLAVKRHYRTEIMAARHAHLDQLGGHHSENLLSTQIFIDVLRDMQRICSHLTAVAYPVIKRKKAEVASVSSE
ncbi:Na/Pi cotransporter family protein [Saccharospirillum alexandrii]|uniref:Na/Pi cotransporter family protein n=1 Tax=Saccharospirillum alexandrii TaxID=2448477 RepID=UPI003736321A